MEILAEVLSKRLQRLPLVWDCGNLATNGNIGFITERIFKDNPEFSKKEVASLIQEHLGIIEPIFIPEPKHDPLAHADGYLTFIMENRAVVSSYPEHWDKDDRQYVEKIRRELKNCEIEVIMIYDSPEAKYYYGTAKNGGIPSARGIYVNFLQLNDTFIVPEFSFGLSGSPVDYNSKNRRVLGQSGDVIPINCDGPQNLGEFYIA